MSIINFVAILFSTNVYSLELTGRRNTPLHPLPLIFTDGDKSIEPHNAFKGSNFIIEPLHAVHDRADFMAWHDDSFEQLQKLFMGAWNWPGKSKRDVSTPAKLEAAIKQNRQDLMNNHYNEFISLGAFAYAIIDPRRLSRVIGTLYIYPESYYTPCKNGDGPDRIYYWIRSSKRSADYEETFVNEIQKWLEDKWPLKNPYMPRQYNEVARGKIYTKMEKKKNLCLSDLPKL